MLNPERGNRLIDKDYSCDDHFIGKVGENIKVYPHLAE